MEALADKVGAAVLVAVEAEVDVMGEVGGAAAQVETIYPTLKER